MAEHRRREGIASRGVHDSVSIGGTTTTPGPAFDMAAVLQATVQATVGEAINKTAQLQSQQAAAMPVISAGETSRLVPLFEPTLSDSRTIGTWIRRVDDLAEVYRWTDGVTSCHTSLAKLHGPAKVWYDSLLSQQKLVRVEVELIRASPTTAGMQRLHREMETESTSEDIKSSCSATQPCSTATPERQNGPKRNTGSTYEKLDHPIEDYRGSFADSTNAAKMR
ncbi:hypothetical protein HPB51_010798 [Rhipicephalus microplus]|uniref:Uncharacterized protein n=1 Tax=Rhipicephalus microplus TaxID=6941 RepID=A0A9J6DV29_RHIMP|nr:hypothetical protein HPB51_010798 [Rhipicephalus microplus]